MISAAPVAAETIGGTTGSSHAGTAPPAGISCRVIIRYGTPTATTRPAAVPAVHSPASTAHAAGAPTTRTPTAAVAASPILRPEQRLHPRGPALLHGPPGECRCPQEPAAQRR